jgi:predicted unusual protein kinase regulating ubiquinone biosynthesis (AarF/ABC1/UbiB family)
MSFKDSARWAKPRVESERAALNAQLKDMIDRESPEVVEQFLHRSMSALESDATPEGQLRRFLLILALLSHHERHATLSSGTLAQLREMGEAILKTQGIYAGTSRLSYLYGDLLASFARIRYREGRHWPYIWQTQLALFLSKSEASESGEQALATANAAFRRGNLTTALEAYKVAEKLGLSTESLEKSRVASIRALRLAGRPEESAVLAAETLLIQSLSEEGRRRIAWEEMCRDVQRHGELNKMISATSRNGDHREAGYILEATLWAKAVASKQYLARFPKAESIRKAFSDSLKRPSPNAQLYECVLQLERCYDNDIPLLKRITDLGDMLDRLPRFQHLDHELLVWAASARWLLRYHQSQMADFVLNEYRALSLRMTDGTLADCLGVTGDLDVRVWQRVEDKAKGVLAGEQETLNRIKTSRLSRAAEMTKLAVGVGGVMIKGRLKSLGRSDLAREKVLLEQQTEIVSMTVDAISKLKGPLVKAAQVLAFAVRSLPEDVQSALAGLRDSVTPMDIGVIREQIQAEFEKPVEELFSEFDDQPLAAASIGQIHRARLHDGREVAVKVQYPNIREVIISDFGLLRLMKPFFRMYFPKANVEEVMEYSASQLLEECNYLREAANQTTARRLFAHDKDILVPEVIHERTGRTVLTMEYVHGARFGEFRSMATQEERNRAGSIIYRFGWTAFLKYGFLNGDPHPGNFLFMNDGRVAFLDFGYAGSFSEYRVGLWRRLFQAALEDRFEDFKEAALRMNVIVPGEPFDFAAAWETLKIATTAIRTEGPVGFTRERITENIETATFKSANRGSMRMALEDGMYLRFAWCLQALLGELGSVVAWRSIMLPLLYGEMELTPTLSEKKTSNAS